MWQDLFKRLENSTSEALAQPVEEAREYVREGTGAVHVDETGWRERNRRAWLWVAARGSVAVYLVRLSRGAKVVRELLGDGSFGGAYQMSDEAMEDLWAVAVKETRGELERPWPLQM